MNDILQSTELATLATLVEEVARSTQEGVKRFVEPGPGTLRRATLRRHHIIFGRRGSGKTSLLRKGQTDLTNNGRPTAFVDLEPYKGHSYPDVLISVLMASFDSFKVWLETAILYSATKTSFWEKLFEPKPKQPPFNRKEAKSLAEDLDKVIKELDDLLHLADNAELQRVTKLDQEQTRQGEASAEIGIPKTAQIGARVTEAGTISSGEEIREIYRRNKIDFLHRHIPAYIDIFKRLSRLSYGDAFLILDDLYHIPRVDQPRVLDYFHRIAKGNNLWLKIGTIRHRSRWYMPGDPPFGLNLGNDADDIDLDLTLAKYPRAKDFLTTILTGLIEECSAPPISKFLADGAIDRLVLASGGVARDFLGVFRRSIDEAHERSRSDPKHYRGPMIGVEDVNLAASKSGEIKMEDLKRDTQDDHGSLEEAFDRIRNFCINRKSSCFLLDRDAKGREFELIDELVDLRLVHLVRSSVTISGHSGKKYKAFMLDVSQYINWRKMRGFEIVEFWTRGSRERLRRASLVYDPTDDQTYGPPDQTSTPDRGAEDKSYAQLLFPEKQK